jgi:hypothetical protein
MRYSIALQQNNVKDYSRVELQEVKLAHRLMQPCINRTVRMHAAPGLPSVDLPGCARVRSPSASALDTRVPCMLQLTTDGTQAAAQKYTLATAGTT